MGWDSKYDFSPFSLEACVYTEGVILFFHEEREHSECLFLLEFFLETKTALLRHVGSSRYETRVGLLFSGSGYSIRRDNGFVTLCFGDKAVLSSSWEAFLADFLQFEIRLKACMKEYFPLMSSSRDFELLF